MAPVDETERQSTNGGDSDTADDCGSEAGKRCNCAGTIGTESPTERSSRKYRVLFEVKME